MSTFRNKERLAALIENNNAGEADPNDIEFLIHDFRELELENEELRKALQNLLNSAVGDGPLAPIGRLYEDVVVARSLLSRGTDHES